MKFRKKPVVVEATQWFKNGDHPLDYTADHTGFQNGRSVSVPAEHRRANNWEGDVVRYYRTPDLDGQTVCKHCRDIMHNHGWIDTLEGGHIVCPGDVIITGVKGEHYPCKPDIFEQTYERMDIEPPVEKPTYPIDRFLLEEQINNCWRIVEELKELPATADINASLHTIYQQKFLKLWDIFQDLVEKDKIK